jgi:tetratricopeptide (TPR) repeat protein
LTARAARKGFNRLTDVKQRVVPVLTLCALAISLAACTMPQKAANPPPPAPVPVVDPQVALRAKTDAAYNAGLAEYANGNYDESIRQFMTALDLGALEQPRQLEARKHMAFSHCVQKRPDRCRNEFSILLAINPNFDLKPTENGHPDWGSVFTTEKQRVLAEQAAAEKKARYAAMTPAERLIADGKERYDSGDFSGAAKLFQDAVKEGIAKTADRLLALKLAAFSLCLLERRDACRAEFLRMLEIDKQVELSPAEASHPVWGRVFKDAKVQAARKK